MKGIIAEGKSFYRKKQKVYLSEPLFHDNEVQANRLLSVVLLISGFILVFVWFAVRFDLFPLSDDTIQRATIHGLLELMTISVVSRMVKNDAWWLKYFLLFSLILVCARLDSMLTHKVAILMVIPVVCSSRYFSRALTLWISLISLAAFAFSAYFGAVDGWIDLNNLTLPQGTVLFPEDQWIASALPGIAYDRGTYIRNTFLFTYLPRCLMFSLAALISANIAGRGRKMVLTQKSMAEDTTRIETELHFATEIQAAMLPDTFPPFPDRREFDVFASMTPAREVGGDFYDFFFVDDTHLALVIADVSGKGVPAALYMMASRIMIRDRTLAGGTPAEILSSVNDQITADNRAELFVTVWLGILDTSSGIITAANAGHEYPILRGGDKYVLLKDKHGPPVGAIECVVYRNYQISLGQGDMLFLYTDGVTEATDPQHEFFGTDKLVSSLNSTRECGPETVLGAVRGDVERFVDGTPQFDDMTMLCIRFNGPSPEG